MSISIFSYRIVILLSIYFSIPPLNVLAQVNTQNIYEFLADMYMPTQAQTETIEAKNNIEIEKYNRELRDKWFNIGSTVQIPALGNVETLRQAYLIFQEQYKEDQNSSDNRLDKATLEDLEILVGNKNNPQRSLCNLFEPYLHTAIGKIQLQKMLCQPLTNIEKLQERQQLIKQFFDNNTKLEQFNEKLKQLTSLENEFLWFWKNIDSSTLQQLRKDAKPELLPFLGFINRATEKIPSATEIESKVVLSAPTLSNPFAMTAAGLSFGLYSYKVNPFQALQKTPIFFSGLYNLLIHDPNLHAMGYTPTTIKLVLSLFASGFIIWGTAATYTQIKAIATYNKATNIIHSKMNSVAKFLHTARELLGKNSLDCNSRDVTSLVKLLDSSTFKNKPSFFAYKGRVITAFAKMRELKDHFIPMLEELGKLDAYIAIASFMQAHENKKNGKYCFPEYINQEIPRLKLEQYWHPFLNPQTVVTNNIDLGGESGKNVIVTGPNAGGKSTSLKGMTLAIILAQTLAIAPAHTMTITPFKMISTYMNIADDPGSESLFQAEMHRAAKLISLVQNHSTNNDKIFIVMDELFSGTNPLEGMAAAYGVIKKLITFKHSSLVFATHFKELTILEDESKGVIKNYKVWVNENGTPPTRSISYPYKLDPGISNQTIALDLLAREGFDKDILKHANDMLDRLKKSPK